MRWEGSISGPTGQCGMHRGLSAPGLQMRVIAEGHVLFL